MATSVMGHVSSSEENIYRFLQMSFLYATETTAAETCMSPYRLQSEIARGSTGFIWSACLEDDCRYAIKVMILRPNNSDLPETIMQDDQFYFVAPTVAEFEQEVN